MMIGADTRRGTVQRSEQRERTTRHAPAQRQQLAGVHVTGNPIERAHTEARAA
jgi:hypothetical protein